MTFNNDTVSINARIKVCGDEIIVKENPINTNIEQLSIPFIDFSLSSYFNSSDPECPIDRFYLSTSNQNIIQYSNNNVILNQDILKVST